MLVFGPHARADQPVGIALQRRRWGGVIRLALPQFHRRGGMGDSHHGPQQHWRIPRLRQFQAGSHKVLHLLAVRRLQHRHLGKAPILPVVLFVLRTEHAGVISHHDDQPSPYAGVDGVEEGVGGYVHPHRFHGHQGPLACVGCSNSHVHSDLLIDRPFGVDLLVHGHVLQDL